MERVQAPQELSEGEVVPSLAPFEPAAGPALEQLVLTARSTAGTDGREAATQLHGALVTLARTEANGTLLLRLLDEHAFDELRGGDGTPTREVAVETLLGLGFPWALQIHPDELAWYRRTRRAQRRVKWLAFGLVLVVGVLAALFLLSA